MRTRIMGKAVEVDERPTLQELQQGGQSGSRVCPGCGRSGVLYLMTARLDRASKLRHSRFRCRQCGNVDHVEKTPIDPPRPKEPVVAPTESKSEPTASTAPKRRGRPPGGKPADPAPRRAEETPHNADDVPDDVVLDPGSEPDDVDDSES